MNNHEVISAFLDDRAFELQDFAATLDQPEGRALLIDLLALRGIVQPTDVVPRMPSATLNRWSRLRPAFVAAAVVVALAGGYLLGLRRAPVVAEAAAPAPTRVVQVISTSEDLPQGVRR
jgi:hypothetical protein